ncbi:MAG: tetratricopeptide repeat protein [Okeania sp. SIO2C2]|nr:tetratricopeptide repeat protein [Okeania sp. SIO2C2]
MTKLKMNKKINLINLSQKAELYLTQGKLEEAILACNQVLEIVSDFLAIYKTLGNIFHKIGEIDKAKEWYLKAISQQPEWAEVHANLGSLYAQEKQWQLAIKSYQEAISIKPNVPGFYRNLGKIWQQIGKRELAKDCQEQALSLEAQYPQASEYLKQGKSWLENEEIESAIANFQKAIKLNPSLANAYQNLGDAVAKQGELTEAINYYQRSIQIQPNLWVAHHKLGKIFQEIGELDAAISSFHLSIEINPNFPWSYKKLADILQEKGELESAEKYYQKVIDIKFDVWEVHRKLVEIQQQKGNLDRAISSCKRVIEINPALTWFYQRLGDNLSNLEPHDLAIDYYRSLLETEPNNIKWLHDIGQRLVKLQEWDEAIIIYRRAIELEANNHLFHRRLADALQEKGLLDEAISSYKTAININPNLSWSYYNLGETLRKLTKWDEAIIAYRHAIELEANNHLFYRRLADALQEKGLLDEAIYNYQKAIEINPKSCWHYAALGNVYLQLENLSEAIPCLIQALKIRPDYYDVHKKIEFILKKQDRHKEAHLWKTNQKLPHNWLRKFLNLTEDWEITSESAQKNLTRINIYSSTQFNLLLSQTIEQKKHHYFLDKKANSAEAFVVVIPEGRGSIDLATSAVITSDNKLVRDVSTGCSEVIISSEELPPINYIDGTVAFLSAKWGGFMYFHWMFDVVTRIDLLRRTNLIIDKFVFTRCDKKFQIETIAALGIKQSQIIESRFFPHIKAQKLVVPSSYKSQKGNLRVSKWGCEFLRSLFIKSQTIIKSSRKPERIYISRKFASWRRVLNEEEVVNLLEKFGFISLSLESMSIAEQALYMVAAKVIVAPHGGGLTNLVFCSPGTKVIEIFSPKYITNFYWEISNLCRLSHYYLIGENFEDDNSGKVPWKPDIIVNLTRLKKMMKFAEVELI